MKRAATLNAKIENNPSMVHKWLHPDTTGYCNSLSMVSPAAHRNKISKLQNISAYDNLYYPEKSENDMQTDMPFIVLFQHAICSLCKLIV
jgi:hypothetical protein